MKRRRRVIQLVLLLIAGAIVNVAVAWGLALKRPFRIAPTAHTSKMEALRFWLREAPAEWSDATPEEGTLLSSFGVVHVLVVAHEIETGSRGDQFVRTVQTVRQRKTYRTLGTHQYGYPSQSLQMESHRVVRNGGGGTSGWGRGSSSVCSACIPLTDRVFDPYDFANFAKIGLPIRPLWPGFAINTIFYAAILWLVFIAPGMMKRTLRRRRGLCPACAYPVGTSEVCTECGKPVKQKVLNIRFAESANVTLR